MGAELWGQRVEDRPVVGENLETRAGGQHLGPARDAIDAYGVAGGQGRDRLQTRIEEAPMAMLRAARYGVMLRHGRSPLLRIASRSLALCLPSVPEASEN